MFGFIMQIIGGKLKGLALGLGILLLMLIPVVGYLMGKRTGKTQKSLKRAKDSLILARKGLETVIERSHFENEVQHMPDNAVVDELYTNWSRDNITSDDAP